MDLLRNPTLEMLKEEEIFGLEISNMMADAFRNIRIEDIGDKIKSFPDFNRHQVNGVIIYRGSLLTYENDIIDSFKITNNNSSEKEKEFEKFINELM